MRNTSPTTSAQAAGQRAHARRKSSTTAASTEPQPKKFACGFDGCGRAFTRSEHLQRHLLNHTAGESTCERCRAHFKRKDLLERHMQRHRQKDEEAGAEGAGVLNTRKRMWKDQEGNIVTKRPNLGKNSQPTSPSSDQHQRSLSTSTTASIEDAVRALRGDAPISPPISSTHSSQSDDYGRRSSDACDATTDPTVETWVFPPLELSPGPETHAYPELEPLTQETDRFWSSAGGLQTSSLRNLSDDVPYDDIFNPDTASSFNMPFTTMNNYNWLFDVDLGAPAAQHFSASTPDILSDEQHSVSGTTIGRSQTTNVLTPLSMPVEERVRAVCIHDVLRPQIFAHAGFNAKPDLWVLQTILLVECFGKSRAGQKQHDMAHLFHGLLINLIRRSDCQTIRTLFTDECSGDLDNDWKRWAEAEQKKRLAYLCFLWDVQHAVLFCQSLCMSAFELRSNLPCNQQLWEADSAELWQRLRKKQRSPPLFLSLVKAYLTPGGPPIPRNLNALSRLLLLHGLMSISWDMKRRDQTSLGLVGGCVGSKQSPIGDWKTRMSTSYNTWKADFDTYCANYLDLFCSGPENPNSSSSNSNSNPSPLRQEFVTWATANAAVYHAAHVLLNAEFLDLQIYAGARHILGRPVGRADYKL
ncbi:putative transcription factor [Diplodia seriata]|uniref:Putative transcription factor n=1 Tax=Diplodia seriata TaxID=420778 RepID=A0A0G2EUZ7_9PEZI|nr:putative transcription factor [Diplodia seriata]